jgi:hypothetical protein
LAKEKVCLFVRTLLAQRRWIQSGGGAALDRQVESEERIPVRRFPVREILTI